MGTGQSFDQHRPAAFTQRLGGDEGLRCGDRVVDPTGTEQGGGVGFRCSLSSFFEAAGLGADTFDVGAVAVGGAVPEVEGGGEQVGGLGCPAPRAAATSVSNRSASSVAGWHV